MHAQTSTIDHKISGADIIVPTSPSRVQPEQASSSSPSRKTFDPSKAETDEFFADMRGLIAGWEKVSKPDIAIILITACLVFGFDTRARIVGALRHLGCDYRHVVITLKTETGNNPLLHRWKLDPEGHYSLHPELAEIKAAGIEVPALKA